MNLALLRDGGEGQTLVGIPHGGCSMHRWAPLLSAWLDGGRGEKGRRPIGSRGRRGDGLGGCWITGEAGVDIEEGSKWWKATRAGGGERSERRGLVQKIY